jgi:ABC-type nitrate/sulfonate/bicarbonate transport system substrate-binding protein
MVKLRALSGPLAAVIVTCASLVSAQEPVTMRISRSNAAEENFWLLIAKPELAPNQGKAYKLEVPAFRSSDVTFKAFEAGQIDGGSASANAVINAASKGLELKIVASLSREASAGSITPYAVRKDSPIQTIADLKGKTIGISGYRTSIDLWARAALIKAGLNPDRDVKWAIVPFPAVAEAIRTGKVDVGGMPELFAAPEYAKGDLRTLFTSRTGIPHDEELIVLIMRPDFLKQHPAAVRAFLADLAAVTKWYNAHLREARQVLLDAKMTAIRPDVFFALKDYVRDPNARPSIELLERAQDLMLSVGFQEKKMDIRAIVDLSLSPPAN